MYSRALLLPRTLRRLTVLVVLALAAALLPLGLGVTAATAATAAGKPAKAPAARVAQKAPLPTGSTSTGYPAGSLIIDMGATQTVAAGLKPYGFVYELLKTYQVPVAWDIKNGKSAMGAADFTVTNLVDLTTNAPVASKTFAGSSFVVSGSFVGDIPAARLTYWKGQGVKIYQATQPLTGLPEFSVMRSWPRIVLDADSSAVADNYYANAGIPTSAYRTALPSALTACDDLFVFPHADPTWTLHKNLKTFNQTGGYIFGQCHAPSVLENIDDPGDADTAPDLNFLSENGLVPYGSHSDGTLPYSYNTDWSDPVLQVMNTLDAATDNGSEQIYLPKSGGWRPTSKVLVWDPDHPQLIGGSGTDLSPGKAAVTVYGRGFGNADNGLVMYQAGHDFAKSSGTANVAAQRTFLNFNLLAGIERSVTVTSSVPTASITGGTTIPVTSSATGGSGVYTYKWTSSCGGTFANSTAANTTFTAPSVASSTACTIRVTVTDSCGRVAFAATSVPVEPTPPPAPSLSMTKSVSDASGDGKAQLGEVLTYSFTVTNTGNVALTNVRINDAKLGMSNVSCVANLAVGETKSCSTTKSYTVVAADIAAGKVDNTATAAATPPTGSDVTANGSATIQAPAVPAISMTKSVADSGDSDTIAALGEQLTYTFTVTNTGNVPLTNVTITDAKLGMSGVVCVANLAVGETKTCPTKTYTTTSGDVNNGSVDNTATASATPPSGPAVTASGSASIATQSNSPAINVTKSVSDASGDGKAQLGEVLTYSFTVTNSGNVPLSDVTITDTKLGVTDAACVSALAVGETKTCSTTKTYTVTAADIAAGQVDNTVVAKAVPATGGTVTGSGSATITAPAVPGIRLAKSVADSADADTIAALGEQLTYTFTVTNTGNVPLTNVTITDAKLSMSGVACVANLAVGETKTCPTKTYTTTSGDVSNGSVNNTATASGTPPSGPATTGTASASIGTQSNTPAVYLVKSVSDANGDGKAQLGEVLTYSFTVTNTGNVPVTNVTLNDPKLGLSNEPCVGSLAVGETKSCPTKTYTVTSADIANGSVTNTATATAVPSTGGTVTSNDSVTIVAPAVPGIRLDKTVADSADADTIAALGEQLTYTFTVTNTGNVPLTNVTITDAKLGMSAVTCVANLAVGETKTCPTKTYTTTAGDVSNGKVDNTATAAGTPPGGGTTTGSDSASIATQSNSPSIGVTKSVSDANGDGKAQLGEVLTYSFTVTNTGNVPLTNVTLSDAKLGLSNVACVSNLAVGETKPCASKTYTVTAADIANGKVDNTAVATATPVTGGSVTGSGSATISAPAVPGLRIDKTVVDSADADTTAGLGETLTYTFSVTNTGNVPLSNVKLTDAKLGLTDEPCVTSLAVGQTKTCPSETYTVTSGDVAHGSVDNTATASATPSSGGTVTGTDTATIATEGPAPRVSVVKTVADSGDADSIASLGETLTYTFTVTNTGNVDLTDVTITDPKLGMTDVACVATLAQGETKTCPVKTYTVTSGDVDHGSVDNTATVKGKTPAGGTVTNQGSSTIPTEQPMIAMTKSVTEADSSDAVATEGEVLTYSFTVTNTGNVPLADVTVSDPKLGLTAAPCVASLPVGQTTSCPLLTSPTYTVTAADVSHGSVDNTATSGATSSSGVHVTAQASASIEAGENAPEPAGLSIDKSVDVSQAAPGDVVTYTLKVRNTGPGSAADVVVTDVLPSGTTFVSASAPCTQSVGTVTCALGTLGSGDTQTVTVKVKVDAVGGGDTSHQHQLDYTKVESHLSLFDGDTTSATAMCPSGYLATDGSVRLDHVDDGTGTFEDAVVLESRVTADGLGWTGTIRNDATGQVQAKVNVVCMSDKTVSGEDHSHPVLITGPVATSQTLPAGRTDVDLACGPGTWAVTPSFTFTAGDGVVSTRRLSAGVWRFSVDVDDTAAATFSIHCLATALGTVHGHSHDLTFHELTDTVQVPAGQVVEVRLTCNGDEKGIVAWADMDPGLVSLGNDPQPVTRVFRFFNPTGSTLSADYGLLCVGIRTNGGVSTGGDIKNTASVRTSSPDATTADDTDSATFAVSTTGVVVAPRAAVVTQAGRTQVALSVRSAGKHSVSITLLAAGKVGGTRLKAGSVLAQGKKSLKNGKAVVRLAARSAASKALRSGKVGKARLVIVSRGHKDVRVIRLHR